VSAVCDDAISPFIGYKSFDARLRMVLLMPDRNE
jgi:hypothetical protein